MNKYMSNLIRKARLFPRWFCVKSYFKEMENSLMPTFNEKLILDTQNFFTAAVYKDEQWNYIRNLTEYREAMKLGESITYEDNNCDGTDKFRIEDNKAIIRTDEIENNWLCFWLKNCNASNCLFSFDVVLENSFTELQLSFKYSDLGNRYRFMLRDNSEAVFEIVKDGEFYHRLFKKPLTLQLKQKYSMKFIIWNDTYFWYIDEKLVYAIKEKRNIVMGNDIDLILYNSNASCPISCYFQNLKFSELHEGGLH